MFFLPIVERELRVASRKRSTAWFRVLAALVAMVIGAGFLIMSQMLGVRSANFGSALFQTLTWLALVVTLGTGVFFTADSLSEEKREGTLGFLFLTDLRGYDVVGGKLLATSLRGCYAFVAIFPILAVTLVMGGVTGMQFWRSSLALLNTLFSSLAAGLFISSLSRDSQRAMAGGVLLLLLVCAAGPLTDSFLMALKGGGFRPIWSFVSPVYVFWAASAWGRTGYWTGLITSHLIGWTWLALACVLAPRTWQDRPSKGFGGGEPPGYRFHYGGARVRAARRLKLLEPNPVVWLALRERWQSVVVWLLAGLMICLFIALGTTLPSMVWLVWNQVSWVIVLGLYLWTASQSSRFFVDARRSGLLELLLVTPLSGEDLVAGQWRAFLRLFGLPVSLFVIVQSASVVFSQHTAMGLMTARPSGPVPSTMMEFLAPIITCMSLVGNLVAIMAVGMWMGLTSRNGGLAALKTLVFVQLLPWFAISFASTVLFGLLMFSRVLKNGSPSNATLMNYPFIISAISAGLTLSKDVAFFLWVRGRFQSGFRAVAEGTIRRSLVSGGQSVSFVPPPVIPVQR
jgi:ABC-type transport system involved in multi-copper enzyme maturation permease subunit